MFREENAFGAFIVMMGMLALSALFCLIAAPSNPDACRMQEADVRRLGQADIIEINGQRHEVENFPETRLGDSFELKSSSGEVVAVVVDCYGHDYAFFTPEDFRTQVLATPTPAAVINLDQ